MINVKQTTLIPTEPRKPSSEEIEKAKNCLHLKQETFIDESFTRIGIYCKKCHLLIKWIEK